MQIIVKQKVSDLERKKKEVSAQILKHYYGREIRDGSRFKVKNGASKEQIKRLYAGG